MPIDLMVLVAAFASGLLGTVHCAAMCGGIATSLSTGQRDGLWMAALPNLGRVLGYALACAATPNFPWWTASRASPSSASRCARWSGSCW